MAEPKKLSDILKEIFGEKFGKDFFTDLGKETTPEEFMKGSDFIKTEETGTDENGNYTKITYVSKDGKRKFTRKTISSMPGKSSVDMELSNRLYTLEMQIKIAAEKEEFEKAAEMRDEIAKIKSQLKKSKV